MPSLWDKNSPTFGYDDFTDESKSTLMGFLQDYFKAASDERLSFFDLIHSDSYVSDREWPDFNRVEVFAAEGSISINKATVMRDVLTPVATNIIATDTIQEGIVPTQAAIPTIYALSNILLQGLGYPSGELLHITQTDEGKVSGLPTRAWTKQWFEVMDYMEIFNRRLVKEGDPAADSTVKDWFSEIETQRVQTTTSYQYRIGVELGLPPECIQQVNGSSSDIYSPGDLNEVPPFSTNTEVRDYTLGKHDDALALEPWNSVSNGQSTDIQAFIQMFVNRISGAPDPDEVTVNTRIETARVRFKMNDEFRPLSPGRYPLTPKIYAYARDPQINTPIFDDLGTGLVEDETFYVDLEKIGDWWYLEIKNPDFTAVPVVPIPAVPTGGPSDGGRYGVWKVCLSPGRLFDEVSNSVYVEPNKDGAWEYYKVT